MKRQYKQDIDFEIKFYEGIVEKQPDFIEALIALGDMYTRKGLYDKGQAIDKRLSALRPEDPIILYNLACSYSLTNNVDASLITIKRAIECGYDDFPFMEKDADLENLRQDGRYKELSSNLSGKKNVQ